MVPSAASRARPWQAPEKKTPPATPVEGGRGRGGDAIALDREPVNAPAVFGQPLVTRRCAGALRTAHAPERAPPRWNPAGVGEAAFASARDESSRAHSRPRPDLNRQYARARAITLT